jgi:hypothetical protein
MEVQCVRLPLAYIKLQNPSNQSVGQAICILARLAAKKAVQEQLRSQGVRVTLVKPAELSVRAQAYLQAHPELIDAAKERALLMGMFEKPRRKSA